MTANTCTSQTKLSVHKNDHCMFTVQWMLTLFSSLHCEDCAPVTGQAAATGAANAKVIGCAQLRFFDCVGGIISLFLPGEKRKQKSSRLGIPEANLFFFFNISHTTQKLLFLAVLPPLNSLSMELFEHE